MKLAAEKRAPGHNGSLRQVGRLPAVVYNKGFNLPVSLDLREFDRVFRSQGTSSIIDLEVGGETHPVLVREVQMNKRRRVPQHVDFYAVTEGEAVEVYVHIDYQGTPVGAREGGQVDLQRRELHIRVLPREIPQHLEVDVSGLAIGDSIHVRDIAGGGLLPPGAEILDDPELTLVTILAPRTIEEPEEAAEPAEAEPQVIGRGGEDDDEEEGEEGEE